MSHGIFKYDKVGIALDKAFSANKYKTREGQEVACRAHAIMSQRSIEGRNVNLQKRIPLNTVRGINGHNMHRCVFWRNFEAQDLEITTANHKSSKMWCKNYFSLVFDSQSHCAY